MANVFILFWSPDHFSRGVFREAEAWVPLVFIRYRLRVWRENSPLLWLQVSYGWSVD